MSPEDLGGRSVADETSGPSPSDRQGNEPTTPGGSPPSGPPGARVRDRIPDLAIEVVAIVLSVLLALALNEWRQEREVARTVEKVHHTVLTELLHNRESVRKALAHHEPLVRDLAGGRHRVAAVPLPGEGGPDHDSAVLERFIREQILRQDVFPDEVRVRRLERDAYLVAVGDRRFRTLVEGDSLLVYGEAGIRLRPGAVRNTAWETAQATRAPLHMEFDLVAGMSEIYRLQREYEENVQAILGILYSGDGSVLAPLQDLVNRERGLLERYDDLVARLGGPTAADPGAADPGAADPTAGPPTRDEIDTP